MSKTPMAPSFVRGNVVYVHSAPPMWAGASPPLKGDRLTVGLRKKGGWLRVRNHRTGDLTSLKVGPWIQSNPVGFTPTVPAVPTFSPPAPPPSPMDQLIRANQIQVLEARIQQMSDDFFNEKERMEACIDKLTQTNEVNNRKIESLEERLDEKTQLAAGQALQLIEAKSQQMALYDKMNADTEAYHRQVDRVLESNSILRQSETELLEQVDALQRGLQSRDEELVKRTFECTAVRAELAAQLHSAGQPSTGFSRSYSEGEGGLSDWVLPSAP